MKANRRIVDDRSRNGRNTDKSPERTILTLMKAVEKTVGLPDHSNGFSNEKLANFFRKHWDSSEFVISYNDDEREQVNQLFERIADCFDFRIEHIKDECPAFYQIMKGIDNSNMIRIN